MVDSYTDIQKFTSGAEMIVVSWVQYQFRQYQVRKIVLFHTA